MPRRKKIESVALFMHQLCATCYKFNALVDYMRQVQLTIRDYLYGYGCGSSPDIAVGRGGKADDKAGGGGTVVAAFT